MHSLSGCDAVLDWTGILCVAGCDGTRFQLHMPGHGVDVGFVSAASVEAAESSKRTDEWVANVAIPCTEEGKRRFAVWY